MNNKYKLLLNITVILLIANVLISFFTNLWKETNYPRLYKFNFISFIDFTCLPSLFEKERLNHRHILLLQFREFKPSQVSQRHIYRGVPHSFL